MIIPIYSYPVASRNLDSPELPESHFEVQRDVDWYIDTHVRTSGAPAKFNRNRLRKTQYGIHQSGCRTSIVTCYTFCKPKIINNSLLNHLVGLKIP